MALAAGCQGVLGLLGGILYCRLTGGWRPFSWYAFVNGAVLCLLLVQMHTIYPSKLPLLHRVAAASAVLIGTEVLAQLVLGRWLGVLWDVPGRSALTVGCIAVSLLVLPIYGWIEYWFLGGKRPEYSFW